MKLIRYGILRRIRRGIRLGIFPSYVCNFKCHYCTLYISDNKKFNGVWPEMKEVGLDEWLEFIDNFPIKVKEVFVTGGEPSLVSYITDLINGLLDRGYLVTVFTNLTKYERFMALPASSRLRFSVTYHHDQMTYVAILKRYYQLKEKFQVSLEEIATQEIKFSKVKTLNTSENSESKKIEKNTLRIAPDLGIFCNCIQMYDYAKEKMADSIKCKQKEMV